MGMEYTAIGGWSPNNPYPQVSEATWGALRSWKVNSIRIPLNQSSWLGSSCVSGGAVIDPDPGNNYRSTLKAIVDRAVTERLYVIIDLHWSAPTDTLNTVGGVSAQCATGQNVMADASHSITFWTQVASAYKSYPNVMFELFNEPYLDQWTLTGSEASRWQLLRDGGTINSYVPLNTLGRLWPSAGYQAMLDAVRATGATNVVLTSGMDWAGNLQYWYTYRPIDPLNQLAAAWHAYPTYGAAWGTPSYSLPKWGEQAYTWAQNILNSNIPVIVTEYGDRNEAGTPSAPFASSLLPRLDTMGVSYLGWTFTAAELRDHQLIKDQNGTPTDGYGVYVKAHYLCRAAGTTSCP